LSRREQPRDRAAPGGFSQAGAWGRVLLAGAILTTACSALHSLIDPDVWFHLAAGRWTLAHGIPRADAFSVPSAGRSYVDLHWLFQLLALAVHRIAREPGLIVMSCAVVTGTLLLVYRQARRHAPASLAAALVALGAVLASERMSPRPEILSFLFLALTGWLLLRHREGWRRALWGLPLVTLLWVNSEGLFILGFLLLAAAILDAPRDRRLWMAVGLCAVASVCNPWFVEGAAHPFVLFTRVNRSLPIYSETIGEFRSPFQDPPLYPSAWLFRYVYLPLLPLALLAAGRRMRRGEILVVAAMTDLAWSARRNIALLPIATLPIFARWITQGWLAERLRGPRAGGRAGSRRSLATGFLRRAPLRRVASIGALLLMAGYVHGLVTNHIYARAETNRRFGLGRAPVDFAREAGRFVVDNRIGGPIFSTFAAGSYFTWAAPQERVFIDGRLEVHTAEHYERYLRMLQGGQAWAQADAQYAFNAAVIQYMEAMELALERLRDPAWAPVHLDDTAIVFLRRNERNAALIERFGIGLPKLRETYPATDAAAVAAGLSLPPVPGALARALGVVRFPWTRLHLGQFFLGLNRPDFAVPQLVEGVRAEPAAAALRIMLAMALNALGAPQAALPVLESAERLGGPRGARARSSIARGDILDRLDRSGEAVAAYDRCLSLLDLDEDRPQAGSVLASRAHAKMQIGDLGGAAADIQQSLGLLPSNAQAYVYLGMIEEKRGRRVEALEAYRRAASLGLRTAEVEEAVRRLGG
jgi:tetratricopeptide (TPR) repeat protein